MNRYFTVTAAAKLPCVASWQPSGIYYGAAPVLEAVLQDVRVDRGDQVHVLFGGTFLVPRTGASPREVRFPADSMDRNARDARQAQLRAWLSRFAVEIPAGRADIPASY